MIKCRVQIEDHLYINWRANLKDSKQIKCETYLCAISCLLVSSIPGQPESDPVYDLDEGDETATYAEAQEAAHLLLNITFTFNNPFFP